MNHFFFIGWVVAILYVLLETSAVVQWSKAFKLKFMKYEAYGESQKKFGDDLKYSHFLMSKYPNFFVFLFTCQECLAVWLNIIGFIWLHNVLNGWATFGVTVLGSILGITAFKWLLKKLYG